MIKFVCTNLLKLECQTSIFSLSKSRLNPFLKPISAKQ